MFKHVLIAAMLLATPVLAQEADEEEGQAQEQTQSLPPKVVTLPIKAVCMGVETAGEMMAEQDFGLLSISKPKNDMKFALWYNSKTHRLIGMNLLKEPKIACLVFDIPDIGFNEAALKQMFGTKS